MVDSDHQWYLANVESLGKKTCTFLLVDRGFVVTQAHHEGGGVRLVSFYPFFTSFIERSSSTFVGQLRRYGDTFLLRT